MDLTEQVLEYQFMEQNQDKWFTSTENPEALALTIRGMLLMYVPVLLEVAHHFGYAWTNAQMTQWVTEISFIVAAVMIVWGLWRKLRKWWKTGVVPPEEK